MSLLVEAEIWTVAKTDQGNAVLVHPLNGEKVVPIFIGPLEAQNILLGIGEIEIPRPLTHDLMLRLLVELGTRLMRVDIHSLSEGTFFSNLIFDDGQRRVEIDARPSDALALAVRAGCPIYINEELVAEMGVLLDQIKQANLEGELDDEPEADFMLDADDEKQVQLAFLQEKLEALVSQERYEEAAEVRDQIRTLES